MMLYPNQDTIARECTSRSGKHREEFISCLDIIVDPHLCVTVQDSLCLFEMA